MDLAHFKRWKSKIPNSYPYILFKKEFKEIKKIYGAFYSTKKFVYKKMGQSGALWEDKASLHLEDAVHPKHQFEIFNDLKDWSVHYELFFKWANYMHVLSLAAVVESYFAKAIKLALDSDIGIVVGCTKTIDGIALKKYDKTYTYNYEKLISEFTKGTWFQRKNAFQQYFNWIPDTLLDEKKIGTLEKIRGVRNDVAHTQGRKLSKIHEYNDLNLAGIEKISATNLKDFEYIVFGLCQEIDQYLLQNHIGNYHVLLKYHDLKKIGNISVDLNDSSSIKRAAKNLQKQFGGEVSQKHNRNFYIEAVIYYENLFLN
ncbi:hypothetical protein [Acinetobacter venetianus]